MMRRIFYSVIALVLIVGLAASTSLAQPEPDQSVEQKLKELLTLRRDTLQSVFEVTKRRHEDGSGKLESYILARDAYLLAELELADSKKRRMEICKERVENFRLLEESAKVRHQSGSVKIEELYLATAERLHAEIDCVREESKPD